MLAVARGFEPPRSVFFYCFLMKFFSGRGPTMVLTAISQNGDASGARARPRVGSRDAANLECARRGARLHRAREARSGSVPRGNSQPSGTYKGAEYGE